MRPSAEGAVAEGGIEAGFTHGAVAFVEVAAEPVSADVGMRADDGDGEIATGLGQLGAGLCVGIVGASDEEVGVGFGMREQPVDNVGIVGAVVGHLLYGAVAEVVVAREAGVSGLVEGSHPEGVVARGVFIGAMQPLLGLALVSGGGFGVVYGADHR